MESSDQIKAPARFGAWMAPLIALLWLSLLLASLALLGYCWHLFKTAWTL